MRGAHAPRRAKRGTGRGRNPPCRACFCGDPGDEAKNPGLRDWKNLHGGARLCFRSCRCCASARAAAEAERWAADQVLGVRMIDSTWSEFLHDAGRVATGRSLRNPRITL